MIDIQKKKFKTYYSRGYYTRNPENVYYCYDVAEIATNWDYLAEIVKAKSSEKQDPTDYKELLRILGIEHLPEILNIILMYSESFEYNNNRILVCTEPKIRIIY